MKKRYKILIAILLALVIFVGIFVVLYSYTSVVDVTVLKLLNKITREGIDIHYSKLEGNLFGTVKLSDVRISTKNVFIKCHTLQFDYSSIDLLDGIIHINYLTLDSPEIIFSSSNEENTQRQEQISTKDISNSIDLSGFPNLNIKRFFLKDGQILFRKNDQTQNHIEDLLLEAKAEINSNKVNIVVKYVKGHWIEKDIFLDELSFQLLGNKKRLTINQLLFIIDNNKIFAHGEVELLPQLRLLVFADTSNIDIPLLKKIIPDFPYKEGYLKFYFDYIGVPKNFTGQLYFKGQLDSLEFYRISSKIDFRNKTLVLKELKAYTNFGNLYGDLQAAPEGRNKINVRFQDFDLQKPSLSTIKTSIDGSLNLRFDTWKLKEITGSGDATLSEIKYGKIAFDTLYLNLEANNGYWDLKGGSRLVVQEASQFYVNGQMTRDRILDCYLSTDRNNLDTLNNRLGLELFGGLGSMDVNIYGPLNNPNISGEVLLDSLTFTSIKTYGIEGNFELLELLGKRLGFVNLELASGNFYEIPLTDGVVDLNIQHNTVYLDSISFYNEDNYVILKGKVDYETELLNIQLCDFAFKYQEYEIYDSDTLKVFLQKDSLFVEDLVLGATGNGEIEVRGMLNFSGECGLAVYFKNIQLYPFNQFIRWKYPLEGLSEISVQFTGKLDSLNIRALADVQNFKLADDKIGDLNADFVYENNRFDIDQFFFQHNPESYFSLRGTLFLPGYLLDENRFNQKEDEQLKLSLEFTNLEISDYPFFKEFNFPVTGNFTGKVEMNGNVSDLSGEYNINGDKIRYRDYQFKNFGVKGEFSPNAITLTSANLVFMNTEITAWGEKAIKWNLKKPDSIFVDKKFSLYLTVKEDSIDFFNILIPDVDILYGDIRASLGLGGNIDNPKLLSGRIDIANGTLFLSKIENPLTQIQFSSVIEEEKLKIKYGKAKLIGEGISKNLFESIGGFLLTPIRKILYPSRNTGELRIAGDIDLSTLSHPKYNLRTEATQTFVNYYLENTKLLFSTNNLEITGRDTMLIRGDIQVHKGEVDLDLKESEKNLMLSTSTRQKPPYMQYLLGVTIPGNFYVRSGATFNSFNIMLRGDLQIIQEPKGFLEMNGNLSVPKGKYFQFEEFNVRDGMIEFTNPKELPNLDLVAEKNKYGYLFQLNVKGKLNNPLKEIHIFDMKTGEDVTSYYPETKDQIALLLFGITFNEIGGSAGTVALEKGGEVINQALISVIEREARRFIGLDEIRVESKGGIIDFTNLRLNQPSQNSVISLGKYLMPNLYLEYKTQLGSTRASSVGNVPTPKLEWEAGNQIYLEYRINQNWSVSSFYAKQLSNKFKIDVSWRHSF